MPAHTGIEVSIENNSVWEPVLVFCNFIGFVLILLFAFENYLLFLCL